MTVDMVAYREAVDALNAEIALQNKAFWDEAIKMCCK